jgi:hypothetical protein
LPDRLRLRRAIGTMSEELVSDFVKVLFAE